MSARRIQVYDTTLRDGAQGEGVSFSDGAKVRFVQRLDTLGVDYVEGGFAGSNEREQTFFRAMRRLKLRHTRVVAFGSTRRARTRTADDPMVANLLAARTPAVAIVGKAWRLHVREVLRTSLSENLAMITDTVRCCKRRGREVLFDAEHFFDGYKDDPAVAMKAVEAAVSAGADVIVLCDTNGGCLPHEIYEITRTVVAGCPVPVAIHAHNDAGVATANSLEGVRAGAVQVQGTVNGYGERCGNADLCSVIPGLMLKMGRRCLGPGALAKLRELALFVADLVNLRPDSRAPYVGQSAFSHKAGQHANAVRKNPRSCEHIRPSRVGNERRFLVSEFAGGTSVLLKAVELGLGRGESARGMREILSTLKAMESRGYAFEAADASFRILIEKVLKRHRSFFDLEGFRVVVEKTGNREPCRAEATIKVRVRDQVEHTAAEGHGPVDALDRALRKALVRFYPEIASVILRDFRVRILDPEEATAATTRVLIESTDGETIWGTVGVSENIIEASWEALVDSVEYKLFREEQKARGRGKRGAARKRKKR